MPPLPLMAVFDELPDLRCITRNKLHRFTDILTIATCAVISGAESCEAPHSKTTRKKLVSNSEKNELIPILLLILLVIGSSYHSKRGGG